MPEVIRADVILASGEGAVGMAEAIACLAGGGAPLDAVEAGIRAVESDPSVRSVGLGGAPNILGRMECDAAVMCGTTLRTGAVGALKGCVHAISVARQVMEQTPHVMLVGEGAARFAREIGVERSDLLTPRARAEYEKWLRAHVPAKVRSGLASANLIPLIRPPGSRGRRTAAGRAGVGRGRRARTRRGRDAGHDTVGFLARARDGRMAGGISTSGWAYKYPGRMSDSGVIGAGLYVDDRCGAAACTHTGEMIIRAGVARAVVAYMKKGAAVKEACREAFGDLRSLKGGYLGPVIIHALDRKGRPYVLTTGGDGAIPYWYWTDGMDAAKRCEPEVEKL
jgi:beta-aspartyl-peptidase (threonine type)